MTAPRRGWLVAVSRTASDGAPLLSIEALAREAGLHPELVRRLVALGALEPAAGASSSPLFPRDAASRLARIARLRRDLGLNCAGALLACDLLARVDVLEELLARHEPPPRR